MERLLVFLLEVIVGFLEVCFSKSHASSEPGHCPSCRNDDDKLEQAYAFMELTRPATLPEVKSRYKKLSLLYHPDRSGGSHEKMQELNAAHALIVESFATDKEEEDEEEEEEAGSEEEQEETNTQSKKQQRKKQREMNQEMRQEWERIRKQKQQFKKQMKNRKKETARTVRQMGLNTVWGRERAYREFVNQAQQHHHHQQQQSAQDEPPSETNTSSLHDICEDTETRGTPTAPLPNASANNNDKPKNHVMECCNSNIAQALRMKMFDVAIDILQDELEHNVNSAVRARVMQEILGSGKVRMQKEIVEQFTQEAILEYLLQPCDDDDNPLLFYAVYYESCDLIRCICHLSVSQDLPLPKIVLQTNTYGQTALDYARIAKDPSILPLVQSQVDLAHEMLQKTRLIPNLKRSGQRLLNLVQNLDWIGVVTLLLAVALGRYAFDYGWIFSILAVSVMSVMDIEHEGNTKEIRNISLLVAFYCAGIGYLELGRWFWGLLKTDWLWKLLLLMAPFGLAFCCSIHCLELVIGVLAGLVSVVFSAPLSVTALFLHMVQQHFVPEPVQRRGLVGPVFLTLLLLLFGGSKVALHLVFEST